MGMEIALREIEIRARGATPVRADLRTRRPRAESPVIIVCHGFLGYKGWGFFPYLSERVAEAGFHVLTISFSLNGTNDGTGLIDRPGEFARNTVSTELDDLRRVCRFVEDGGLARAGAPGATGERLGLFGHSRGGAVALLVAAELPAVRSLVTWSALGKLDRYTPRRKIDWRRTGALAFNDERAAERLRLDYAYYEDIDEHRSSFDLPRAAASLAIPHLMIHGERDQAVTLREARLVADAARPGPARFEVIRGAGHTFNIAHPMRRATPALEQAVRSTTDWFTKTLTTNGKDGT